VTQKLKIIPGRLDKLLKMKCLNKQLLLR